jgi:hypothetical protein
MYALCEQAEAINADIETERAAFEQRVAEKRAELAEVQRQMQALIAGHPAVFGAGAPSPEAAAPEPSEVLAETFAAAEDAETTDESAAVQAEPMAEEAPVTVEESHAEAAEPAEAEPDGDAFGEPVEPASGETLACDDAVTEPTVIEADAVMTDMEMDTDPIGGALAESLAAVQAQDAESAPEPDVLDDAPDMIPDAAPAEAVTADEAPATDDSVLATEPGLPEAAADVAEMAADDLAALLAEVAPGPAAMEEEPSGAEADGADDPVAAAMKAFDDQPEDAADADSLLSPEELDAMLAGVAEAPADTEAPVDDDVPADAAEPGDDSLELPSSEDEDNAIAALAAEIMGGDEPDAAEAIPETAAPEAEAPSDGNGNGNGNGNTVTMTEAVQKLVAEQGCSEDEARTLVLSALKAEKAKA